MMSKSLIICDVDQPGPNLKYVMLKKGKKILFRECAQCHTEANITGPNLHGLFGQKTNARLLDSLHTDANKNKGKREDALIEYLENPKSTSWDKMIFAGIKKKGRKGRPVAYLKKATDE
ncbi:cytochrome c, somatic-like [Rattus rattus]|uniref:cytochrome c, somatic-like n=1 Tax=Rattus rattus TaxID=10117 RepID=UPI0013F2C37D|nr:cytochrome c, somatic-like [Rattus rattus]